MIPSQLNAVVIMVRDLATMTRFYETLGWTAHASEGLFAFFKLKGANLVLFRADAVAEELGLNDQRGGGFGGITPAVVFRSHAELDTAIEQARGAGGKIIAVPGDRPWGGRTAYFADPEMNVWELACPRDQPAEAA